MHSRTTGDLKASAWDKGRLLYEFIIQNILNISIHKTFPIEEMCGNTFEVLKLLLYAPVQLIVILIEPIVVMRKNRSEEFHTDVIIHVFF